MRTGRRWESPRTLAFLIDTKKPVIDGVSGKDGSDTLQVASPDTVTDGTVYGTGSEVQNDENAIIYSLNQKEKYRALDVDLGGTVLKITNPGVMVRKWVVGDDAGM